MLCIAGREVLGRKLAVIKTTKKKDAVWVKGAVNDFDEPSIRHKVCTLLLDLTVHHFILVLLGYSLAADCPHLWDILFPS